MAKRLQPPYEPRDKGQEETTPTTVPSAVVPTTTTVPGLQPIKPRAAKPSELPKQAGAKFKAPMPKGEPGLWNAVQANLAQVGEMSKAAVPGMATFFGGIGRDAFEAVKTLVLPWELAKGITNTLGVTDYESYKPRSSEEFLKQFGETFSPKVYQKYIDAIRNNQPIAAYLVQDAGNLLIVGGIVSGSAKAAAISAAAKSEAASAAGQAARAATYGKLARAGETVSTALEKPRVITTPSGKQRVIPGPLKMLDNIGNAPWHVPYVMLPKGVGRVFREGLPYGHQFAVWGEAGVKQYNKIISDYRDLNPDSTYQNDPTLRGYVDKLNRYNSMSNAGLSKYLVRAAVRFANHESSIVARTLLNEQTNPIHKNEINPDTGKPWGELSPAENEAIIATLNGRAQLVKFLMETTGLPLEKVVMFGRYNNRPDYSLSIDGARLALSFINGDPTLSEMQIERLTKGIETVSSAIVDFTQKSVSGYGRRFPLSKEYLIPLPFTDRLEREIMNLGDPDMIEAFNAAKENGVFDLPADDAMRQNTIISFVEMLPDGVALDSSMYPAAMRENIEFYKRFRAALNQELLGRAEGNPLPPYDQPPVGPDEYRMTARKGKLSTTEKLKTKTTERIDKLKKGLEKAYARLGKLETQNLMLQAKLAEMNVVDMFISGMTAKQIAAKFKASRLRETDVMDILNKDKRAQAWIKLQEATAALEAATAEIGKKRAAMTPAELQQEMADLQAAIDQARADAEIAADEYENAKIENQRIADRNKQVEDYLLKQIEDQENIVADAEDNLYRAGGDPTDLLEPVPLVDPSGISPLPGFLEGVAETAAEDPEFMAEIKNVAEVLDSIERLIAEEDGVAKNPTRLDAENLKRRLIDNSEKQINEASMILVRIGAEIDPVTGRPVFKFVPKKTPEYDWWWALDIKLRRKISLELLRGEKDYSGKRISSPAMSIDNVVMGVAEYIPNMDINSWSEMFVDAARKYLDAQALRNRAKKSSVKSILEDYDYFSQEESKYVTQEYLDRGQAEAEQFRIQEEYGINTANEANSIIARAEYLSGARRPEDIFADIAPEDLPDELAPISEEIIPGEAATIAPLGSEITPIPEDVAPIGVTITPVEIENTFAASAVDVESATRRTGVEGLQKVYLWRHQMYQDSWGDGNTEAEGILYPGNANADKSMKMLKNSFEVISDISDSVNTTKFGNAARLVTALNQLVMWVDAVRKAKTTEEKIRLIINTPDFVHPEMAKQMLRGMSRENLENIDIMSPNHPIRKFNNKVIQYINTLTYELSVLRHVDETYGEATLIDWNKISRASVETPWSNPNAIPGVNMTVGGIPDGTPFIAFSADTPKEVVLDAIDALIMAVENDKGATKLRTEDFIPRTEGGPSVKIYGLPKYNIKYKNIALRELMAFRKAIEAGKPIDPEFYQRTGKEDILAGLVASPKVNTKDAKPKGPFYVPVEDIIADPVVRKAAYEKDVLTAMARKESSAVRKAKNMEQRFKAIQSYLDASSKYADFKSRFDELQVAREKKAAQYQQRLQKIMEIEGEKIPSLKKKLADSQKMLAALSGPDYETLMSLTGSLPLKWVTKTEFPTEQSAVDVPIMGEGGVIEGYEQARLLGPMYLPSGSTRSYVPGRRVEIVREGLRGWEKLTSEHRRDADRETVFSIIEVANRLRRDLSRMTTNERWRFYIHDYGTTASRIIGEERSKQLWDDATQYALNLQRRDAEALFGPFREAEAEVAGMSVQIEGGVGYVEGIGAYAPGNARPVQVFEMARRQRYGQLIAEEMAVRGWVPVNVYGDIESSVAHATITTEAIPNITQYTWFLPASLKDGLVQVSRTRYANASMDRVFNGLGRLTSFFKTGTLVLSTSWQIGDMVSNLLIAQASGIPVNVMIRRMRQVAREEYGGLAGIRSGTMTNPNVEMPAPGPIGAIAQESQVQDLSIQNIERQRFMGQKEQVQKPPRFLKRPRLASRGLVARSFKLNETINRLSRHAYFLEVLDRSLQERGLSLENMAMNTDWKYSRDDTVRKLMEEAAATANKWLGDYANLSLAERKYFIPFVPFYGWTKHVHQIFYALGLDHPESLKFYVYMGAVAMNSMENEDDPFNLRSGNLAIGGGYASANFLNPFADVLAGPVTSYIYGEGPGAALRSLGPGPRLAGAAIFGTDITSGRPISRPAGTSATTATGLPVGTPLWQRPKELLGYTLQQFPLAQRLANINPTPFDTIPGTNIALGPVARYQTGEARTKPGTRQRIEQPGGRLAAVGRLFSIPGIPYRSEEQVKDIEKSALQRLRTLETIRRMRELYGAP